MSFLLSTVRDVERSISHTMFVFELQHFDISTKSPTALSLTTWTPLCKHGLEDFESEYKLNQIIIPNLFHTLDGSLLCLPKARFRFFLLINQQLNYTGRPRFQGFKLQIYLMQTEDVRLLEFDIGRIFYRFEYLNMCSLQTNGRACRCEAGYLYTQL